LGRKVVVVVCIVFFSSFRRLKHFLIFMLRTRREAPLEMGGDFTEAQADLVVIDIKDMLTLHLAIIEGRIGL
jgi:hypothetical protein